MFDSKTSLDPHDGLSLVPPATCLPRSPRPKPDPFWEELGRLAVEVEEKRRLIEHSKRYHARILVEVARTFESLKLEEGWHLKPPRQGYISSVTPSWAVPQKFVGRAKGDSVDSEGNLIGVRESRVP